MADATPSERSRLHTATFTDPGTVLRAAVRLRQAGFTIVDAYTPFAVHGLDEALGAPETRLPWATFLGGTLGLTAAVVVQVWTHAVSWPLNIGGKSVIAWPALVPVAFELTVLCAAFATVGALAFAGRLRPRLALGLPADQPHARVTDDRFVLVIAEEDASFERGRFVALCRELGASAIQEGWQVR